MTFGLYRILVMKTRSRLASNLASRDETRPFFQIFYKAKRNEIEILCVNARRD